MLDNVEHISIGTQNSYTINYAVKKDGTLWAWGEGELLLDKAYTVGPYPADSSIVRYLSKPTEIMSNIVTVKINNGSRDFCLVVKKDGSLWSWGYNYSGQIGNGKSGKDISEESFQVFSSGSMDISTATTPTTPNLNINDYASNDKWNLMLSACKSFLTHKITNTTYESETCNVIVNLSNKQFKYPVIGNPSSVHIYTDAEKEELKIRNAKVYVTIPENVSIERVDNDEPIVIRDDPSVQRTQFFELGDIGYDDYYGKTFTLKFTFNPTQAAGFYDIKFRATADNADELNTTYKINYQEDLGGASIITNIPFHADTVFYNTNDHLMVI